MRYSNIFLLCLLATAFYSVFHFTTSSSTTTAPISAPAISLPGGRRMRSLNSYSSGHEDPNQNIKKVDADVKKTGKLDTSAGREYANSNDDAELVYNIDYNGVTTHPTPTPKHP